MKQGIQRIKVRDLFDGYREESDGDVYAFSGLLCVSPKFQREFIYNNERQVAVIETILDDCNLAMFTWFSNMDGTYELGDGKQRTMSILNFLSGKFAIITDNGPKFYFNLSDELKEKLLAYEIYVVVVSGTAEEKLRWFKRINTAGLVLTDQELRNATYTGPWLESAKQYFSKPSCPAWNIGSKYISGTLNRQDYLEVALDWISSGNIEEYMAKHQLDENAEGLWEYFESVLNWVKSVFIVYRKEMKGLGWGRLFRDYGSFSYDSAVIEDKIKALMIDDDVTKKSGAYEYVLSLGRKEKCLSIRAFTESQKRTVYEKQEGICPVCGKHFKFEEMEGDHIIPWSKGGKTELSNLQMLCRSCNNKKSDK